jgi:hypothetical protein
MTIRGQSGVATAPAREVDWEVLPPEEKARRASVEPLFKWVAFVMDGLLGIPGSKRRLGLNPLIDFIPVVGDVSAAVVSASVLLYGVTRGLPKILLARMALNVVLNEVVGAVPLVGSAFAFWFRPNQRNYDLLKQHANAPVRPGKSDWIFVVAVIACLFLVILAGLVVSVLILQELFKVVGVH